MRKPDFNFELQTLNPNFAQRQQPYYVMPCVHGVGPVVAAWFVGRDRPAWRWPLAALLLAALPSIALFWQDRPIDILLGTVAAGIGIALGEWFYRRETAPLQRMQPLAQMKASSDRQINRLDRI